jgi:hypothetical protein
MIVGLQAAQEMAAHIASIHTARAEQLEEAERYAAAHPEYEHVPEVYTAAEMARARASVAAGLATAFKLRAEEEPTPVSSIAPSRLRPWWRRWLR